MIFSSTKRAFEVKKTWQVLSFRLKKQTNKNAADTTFTQHEEFQISISLWVQFSEPVAKIYWTLDVSRTACYEITLVHLPSVSPSVCSSLRFLKIGSLVFSDIVHDDSWSWYLVTHEVRLLKKKLAARIWATRTKIGPETRFFAIFSSLVH